MSGRKTRLNLPIALRFCTNDGKIMQKEGEEL